MSKYYIVISDRLISSLIFFLLVAAILLEFNENSRKKVRVTENSTKKNLCEAHDFFCLHYLPLVWFLSLFCLLGLYVKKKFCSKKGGKELVPPSSTPHPLPQANAYSPDEWMTFWKVHQNVHQEVVIEALGKLIRLQAHHQSKIVEGRII